MRLYNQIPPWPGHVELPHFKMHSSPHKRSRAASKRQAFDTPAKLWLLEALFRAHFAQHAEEDDPLPIAYAQIARDKTARVKAEEIASQGKSMYLANFAMFERTLPSRFHWDWVAERGMMPRRRTNSPRSCCA